MKTTNNIIAIVLWLIGVLMLVSKSNPPIGALFFVPFALGPHAVTHLGVILAKKKKSQSLLLTTMLLYFTWFTFVYINAFYTNLDPQSGIALVFVGIWATPVMLIFWALTTFFELKRKDKQNGKAINRKSS